jgi:hypothetical protein
MENLIWLKLVDTQITFTGVMELQKALPMCEIRTRAITLPASVLEQAWREV